MKKKIYYFNTSFELQLEKQAPQLDLEKELLANKICMQLQFLPSLIANSEDSIFALGTPPETFEKNLRNILKDDFPFLNFFSTISELAVQKGDWSPWAPSPALEKASNRQYMLPLSWEKIRHLNSKIFSYRNGAPLANSFICENTSDLPSFLQRLKTRYVIKGEFGVSGRGNFWINTTEDLDQAPRFCQTYLEKGQKLIAEPIHERLLDFSSQWHLGQAIEQIGCVQIENTPRGIYKKTMASNDLSHLRPFLEEHIHASEKFLQILFNEGYRGFVGIDAFVYQDPETQKATLYPIVEANCRATMSLIAILFQKKYFPDSKIELCYKKKESGALPLLPEGLTFKSGQFVNFDKQLYLNIL